MRVTKLAAKTPEQGNFYVVGDDFMMMRGKYDPRQLWFSFMDRAIFQSHPDPEPTAPYTRHHFKVSLFAKIDDRFRLLHPTDYGARTQMVLPFHEGKRLTHRQFSRLKSVQAQTWERDANGEFYTIEVRNGEDKEIVSEWCIANLRNRFHIQGKTTMIITFESSVDAINAKLKFS
jgi:hypothetical protein